ncbi:MAG: hypothetical protein NTY35_00240 [Planctomycetota bacterium]|nr:hypothetical protein [Planctomycetota bacterium]
MTSEVRPGVSAIGAPVDRFWDRTLRVAWWSVALGIGLEVVQLVLFAFQDRLPTVAQTVAETAGKVSWSVLVCVSISCGLAAGKARPRAMGLLGALSAPVGFAIARSVHKSVGSALSVAPGAAEALSPFLLAGIKAVEYGALGLVVARLTSRPVISLRSHLVVGLSIGAVTALVVSVLLLRLRPDTRLAVLATQAVAEVLFPIGCAAVIYVTERAARLARRDS